MKPDGSILSRIRNSISELLNYRGTLRRIRFSDSETFVSESSDQTLVRQRIRAAALVLLVAKVAFTVRSLILDGRPVPLDGVIIIGLSLISIWLYSPRNISMFRLRAVETLMFLGMSLQLGLQLHNNLRSLSTTSYETPTEATAASVAFVVAVKDQIIATFGMMMIYGMFIPNRARRAALMVFLMAITPGIVIVANRSSLQAIEDFRNRHVLAVGVFSGNLLALCVGAGCAIYGTAIMNRWRNRALEAEQLGQYHLREKIGSGGMGDVYLAEHRLLKRLCAVKLIRADMSEDPVMVTRFEREVRATAALTHWNTVQVFDYGQTAEGTFFYVMEHLHGKNLRQLVLDFGPMCEARVVFVLRQVAEALREAAARNLVHRDIKPSNVFLAEIGGRFDVVKLLDFGLVRPLTSVQDAELSAGNELKGSPRYMCPEQAQGQSPDSRGDIYSLGATAYFLLAGRPPFDMDSPLQLVIAHATEPAPTFQESNTIVSPELSAIVMKCLQKLPEERFQTPDELIAALDALLLQDKWNWTIAEEWWKYNKLETNVLNVSFMEKSANSTVDNDAALEETLIDTSGL